jgi:hypothetical protein
MRQIIHIRVGAGLGPARTMGDGGAGGSCGIRVIKPILNHICDDGNYSWSGRGGFQTRPYDGVGGAGLEIKECVIQYDLSKSKQGREGVLLNRIDG